MKRLLLSVAGGTVITFALLIISGMFALLLSQHDIGIPLLRVLLYSLYWPLSLKHRLGIGFDCDNADYIADKLSCTGIALIIDVLAYSLLMYGILRWRKKRVQLS